MDGQFIKPHIKPDANYFINDLKAAVDIFKQPDKNSQSNSFIDPVLFDKYMADLIKTSQNFYSILTDEGKILVQRMLRNHIKAKVSAF